MISGIGLFLCHFMLKYKNILKLLDICIKMCYNVYNKKKGGLLK